MTTLKLTIAQHLEIPKEHILEIKEYPEKGTVNVILHNYAKHTITTAQLAYAAQKLQPGPTDEETAITPGLIVGLGRASIDRLSEAGITTLDQLIAHQPEEIAAIVKQNVEVTKSWLKKATALLEG